MNHPSQAEGAFPIYVKLATGDNVITLADHKIGYDATTNPRGINSSDEYDIWFPPFSSATGNFCALGIKTSGGVVSKTATTFTLVAHSDLNTAYVTIWILPVAGITRTII
jgi:hypothetical protein